jgi:hypothetical protein
MSHYFSYFYFFRLPPLCYYTIAAILGIYWQTTSYISPFPLYLYVVTFFLLFIIFGFFKILSIYHPPYLLTCLMFFTIGSGLYKYQQEKHINFDQTIGNSKFDAQGCIAAVMPLQHPRFKERITLDIIKIKKDDNKNDWQSYQASIYIYLTRKTDVRIADTIRIDNIQGKKQHSFSSFDQYLIKEGIQSCLFQNRLQYHLVDRPAWSFKRSLAEYRAHIFDGLKTKLSTSSFSLFSSLFLGNKAICKQEIEPITEEFKVWGISHYLARSGLHLVVFVFLWHALLRFIPLPFMIKQLIMLILCLTYHLLSWTSISFIRALYTYILYKWCALFKLQTHFVHLLTFVCLTTLLYNPMQLFFLDFQLSFGLTFALGWFAYAASIKMANY